MPFLAALLSGHVAVRDRHPDATPDGVELGGYPAVRIFVALLLPQAHSLGDRADVVAGGDDLRLELVGPILRRSRLHGFPVNTVVSLRLSATLGRRHLLALADPLHELIQVPAGAHDRRLQLLGPVLGRRGHRRRSDPRPERVKPGAIPSRGLFPLRPLYETHAPGQHLQVVTGGYQLGLQLLGPIFRRRGLDRVPVDLLVAAGQTRGRQDEGAHAEQKQGRQHARPRAHASRSVREGPTRTRGQIGSASTESVHDRVSPLQVGLGMDQLDDARMADPVNQGPE